MNVKEAIEKIYAPKGITSIIAGIGNGDFSVLNNQKGIEVTFAKAEEMEAKYQKQLDECKSDWAYWSILGDLMYWKAVRNILEAGLINNGVLANVEAPNLQNCVVMDAISKVEKFGKSVLFQTRALKNIKKL